MCKSRRFRPRARTAKVADLRMCKSRHFSVCTCVQSRHFSCPRRTHLCKLCADSSSLGAQNFLWHKSFPTRRTSLCDVFVSVAQMCCFRMCTHSANVHTFRAHVLKIPVRVTSTPGTCALPRTPVHKCAQPKHTVHIRAHLVFIGNSWASDGSPTSFEKVLSSYFLINLSSWSIYLLFS